MELKLNSNVDVVDYFCVSCDGLQASQGDAGPARPLIRPRLALPRLLPGSTGQRRGCDGSCIRMLPKRRIKFLKKVFWEIYFLTTF